MRQVVLDTETTGLEPSQGHRIIEIGCVEMINRRITGKYYHVYLQPDREIDAGAIEVHGITNEFLADKPRFNDVQQEFIAFIDGAELVIHNAAFDVGFIEHEFKLNSYSKDVAAHCTVLDTLLMARKMHPGKRNSLDALCKRYEIDNTQRTLHGALLDSEILAEVYLAMTGGQVDLLFSESASVTKDEKNGVVQATQNVHAQSLELPILSAFPEELDAHEHYLETLRKAADECVWDKLS